MSRPVQVATLVVDPKTAELTDAFLARVAQALPGAPSCLWLEKGVAADLVFEGEAGDAKAAAALAGSERADLIVQPLASRAKRLLVADMDSTLIGQECIDELADVVGVGAHVAAITERAMRGELEFEPALRERVRLLKGLPLKVIEDVLKTRITLNPGARTLTATMRARGGFVAIVSGGFTPFTGAVAGWIGADTHRANRLGVEDERLTGLVIEPILGRDAKLAALREFTRDLGLAREDTLAIGDGANDLAMLGEAGLGVAYRAKPKVAAAAAARIDHADLSALLYAQGLTKAEFVAG